MQLYRDGLFGVTVGDITKVEAEAVVNSTNPGFDRGFGVDSAIHEAAGPELAKALEAIGSAGFGEARLTPGFNMAAKHIIHVVAPVWKGGDKGEEALLAKAYESALALAKDTGIKTIVFPAISTGTYAYPFETATRIALETVDAFAKANPGAFTRVMFSPFSAADGEVYNATAAKVFA